MPIVMNGSSGNSRGFTLVEMSIVLVIIGLIIGGILKGQEIIASARQKAVINQVNAVRAAANTYFDRYRALPGDDPTGSSVDGGVKNGNGDGVVGSSTAPTTAATIGSGDGHGGASAPTWENFEFFNGLIAANLINGGQLTGSGTTSTTQFGTSALPASPITGAGVTVLYGAYPATSGSGAKTTHWLRLHKGAQTPTVAISPRTLANIDTQTDDGQPWNGGTRSAGGSCDSGTSYATSDDVLCIGLFEVTQ